MLTSKVMVRRLSPLSLMTAPLVVRFVDPSLALTGFKIVLPLVPSTPTSNSVVRGTRLPDIFRRKSGTDALPRAVNDERTPSTVPVELRIPAMPANTLISALLNVYSPSRGVSLGPAVFHGPKEPVLLIAPGGFGFVSEASSFLA